MVPNALMITGGKARNNQRLGGSPTRQRGSRRASGDRTTVTSLTLREPSLTRRASRERLFDPSAAEDPVAIVANDGLAGCDAKPRLVEGDVQPAIR